MAFGKVYATRLARRISLTLRLRDRSKRPVRTRTICCSIVLAPSRRRDVVLRHIARAMARTSNPECCPWRRSSPDTRSIWASRGGATLRWAANCSHSHWIWLWRRAQAESRHDLAENLMKKSSIVQCSLA